MAAALAIARQGLGRTAPNPSVGAVIVRWDAGVPRVVGLARTADSGRPHAEALALEEAGEAARGATCYVTLEPCSHHGRSPPCADALIAAGVARVVVAARDPNPLVAGGGLRKLEAAGIVVTTGVRADEAERDLAGHLSTMGRRRPHVLLKMALSDTGAIGLAGEGQVALSGPQSNAAVHLMRAEADAIVVGIGTVMVDDPQLTVRLPGLAGRSPARVVLDTWARTPPGSRLFAEADRVPVIVMVGARAPASRMAALRAAGALVLEVPMAGLHLDLKAALSKLSTRGIMSAMVEGGAMLAQALVAADLVDEAVMIETPTALPAGDAVLPFGGRGVDALARRLRVLHVEKKGDDRWVRLVRR